MSGVDVVVVDVVVRDDKTATKYTLGSIFLPQPGGDDQLPTPMPEIVVDGDGDDDDDDVDSDETKQQKWTETKRP